MSGKSGLEIRAPLPYWLTMSIGDRVAGLLCSRHWNHLFISAVFVDKSERGKGVGRQLLLKAEELALQEKCTAFYLDTFDFQAPGFYEKLGFKVFGILKDHPPGHHRYSMVKVFPR
jgi:GNAT superfamily N-acetyltransferase